MPEFARDTTDRHKLEEAKLELSKAVSDFKFEFPLLCEAEDLNGHDVIAIINANRPFASREMVKLLDKHKDSITACLDKIRLREVGDEHSFLDECEERKRDLQKALRTINDNHHIHFIVGITLGGGTAGITRLLIDEIFRLRSDQRITVTFVGTNPDIKHFNLLKSGFSDVEFRHAKRKEAIMPDSDSLVVGIQLNEECYVLGNVDISFRILPNEQTVELVPSNFMGVTQNLFHPYGALPINAGLYEVRQQRDLLSEDQLHRKRLNWIKEYVDKKFYETLIVHGKDRKFNPMRSAWSLAYFQDSGAMLEEFDSICKFLKEASSEYMTQIGGRVVYFMVQGSHICASLDLNDLVARGVAVITPERIIEPIADERAPVTALVLPNLPRDVILELNTLLAGTLSRSEEGYIDWPRIVTGNASWLECVSAGVPCVHDGYDGGLGRFEQPLDLLVDRYNILTGSEVESRKFLAGRANPVEVYGDLVLTTQLARDFSLAAQKANLAHDILRSLAAKKL